MNLKKGDRLLWMGVSVSVLRVAADGTWADVKCRYGNKVWSKRQPLPMEGAEILEPIRIYINSHVGWCAYCGAPILDNGFSDDPEFWEHSWAYPKHGADEPPLMTLGI